MEGSVNVNAGGFDGGQDGAYDSGAREPQSFDYDAPESVVDGEPASPVMPLRWVDAPRAPEIGPPRVPQLPRQIGANRPGPRGALNRPFAESDQGPCLYFGPAGQRCDRRALEGGFCSKHQPASQLGASPSLSAQQISKRALGIAGILAVLWPILFDVIREIVRLLR